MPWRQFGAEKGLEGQGVGAETQEGGVLPGWRHELAAPPAQFEQHGFERAAERCQLVDRRAGRRGQGALGEQALFGQAFEPFGEQVRADAGEPVEQVFKAAGAGHQFTDDEQRPAFADDVERIGKAAVLLVASICH